MTPMDAVKVAQRNRCRSQYIRKRRVNLHFYLLLVRDRRLFAFLDLNVIELSIVRNQQSNDRITEIYRYRD